MEETSKGKWDSCTSASHPAEGHCLILGQTWRAVLFKYMQQSPCSKQGTTHSSASQTSVTLTMGPAPTTAATYGSPEDFRAVSPVPPLAHCFCCVPGADSKCWTPCVFHTNLEPKHFAHQFIVCFRIMGEKVKLLFSKSQSVS